MNTVKIYPLNNLLPVQFARLKAAQQEAAQVWNTCVELPENSRSVSLVWKSGFELHVSLEIAQAEDAPGDVHATVDLGEIHLAAVTTNTEKAMIVTGRGIRSLKRQRSQQLGKMAKKQ